MILTILTSLGLIGIGLTALGAKRGRDRRMGGAMVVTGIGLLVWTIRSLLL